MSSRTWVKGVIVIGVVKTMTGTMTVITTVIMTNAWVNVEEDVAVVANINCGCFLSDNKIPREHLLNIL